MKNIKWFILTGILISVDAAVMGWEATLGIIILTAICLTVYVLVGALADRLRKR